MRLAGLYVISAFVIAASCKDPCTDDATTSSPSVNLEEVAQNVEETAAMSQIEDVNDTLKIRDPTDPINSKLPILPPIVLLDFGDDDENSTSGDDKTKRTIDGNLGYGFLRNNLLTGRTNYYFPSGKTGTTVSIEESISPFHPKTIIENVKPISEKPESEIENSDYPQNPHRPKNSQTSSGQRGYQGVQSPRILATDNRYTQPIFGQRTKLYKPSQIDYSPYRGFTSTPASAVESQTTPRTEFSANGFSPSSFNPELFPGAQTTLSPVPNYSTTPAPSYVTPTSAPYQTRYHLNSGNNFGTARPSFGLASTPRPQPAYSPEALLAPYDKLPRFTLENGVRYENKIVWKYADGRVSATPPISYVNAYKEFLLKQNPGAAPPTPTYQNPGFAGLFSNLGINGNYQNPGVNGNYQNFGTQAIYPNVNYQSQLLRYPNPEEIRAPFPTLGNIYSKSPAQFPKDPEPAKQTRPSQFVSSASLQSSNFGIGSGNSEASSASSGQAYDFGYQGQYGLKTPVRAGPLPGSPNPSSAYGGLSNDGAKPSKDSHGSNYQDDPHPTPKYAVNSPNPEYTYSTESPLKSSTPISSNLLKVDGSLTPEELSKYSTTAPYYSTKNFDSEKTTTENYEVSSTPSSGQNYGAQGIQNINTDYDNLLSQNPSLFQYIRDPSLILKAKPTYVQAGNSLIPVIILKVDGAPPIQRNTTPNINLKALLQQYLTQYAGSIGQNSKNDFSNIRSSGTNPTPSQSPLYELSQLTQSLSRYSQDPSIANNFANNFGNNFNRNSYGTSNSFAPISSYDADAKIATSEGLNNNYGDRRNKSQKIKSVQIIDDPRFTSYKVNA